MVLITADLSFIVMLIMVVSLTRADQRDAVRDL